jgi:hypothetical protein
MSESVQLAACDMRLWKFIVGPEHPERLDVKDA